MNPQFPNQLAPPLQRWRSARRDLEAGGFVDSGRGRSGGDVDAKADELEDLLDFVSDGGVEKLDTSRVDLLSWLITVPAKEIRQLKFGLAEGEKSVDSMLEYVESYLGDEIKAVGSLDDVHREGERIKCAANALLAILTSEVA